MVFSSRIYTQAVDHQQRWQVADICAGEVKQSRGRERGIPAEIHEIIRRNSLDGPVFLLIESRLAEQRATARARDRSIVEEQ